MDSQLESLKVLIEGIKLAQKRGAFTLEESADLWQAIKSFIDNDTNLNENNHSNLNQINNSNNQ